jgi:glutathione synthase/RimK-type ligase-like ATP-grasp enzyme
MKEIAFVTCDKYPALTSDDQLVTALLSQAGIRVIPAIWDQVQEWQRFDLIVIRSCWDYHLKLDLFLGWINQLDQQALPLFNPANVIKWNADKSYLRDLKNKQVDVTPTIWLKNDRGHDLNSILDELGWQRAVIKPAVSATALQTWVITRSQATAYQARLEEILIRCDALLQPFIEEIQHQGEWSFIFFNKAFSHAVLKRAQAGDFRVQEEYGGTATALSPPVSLIEQATEIVRSINEPLLFARVDGVEIGGKLVLMELELIEPALFLGLNDCAPANFAAAIAAQLQ